MMTFPFRTAYLCVNISLSIFVNNDDGLKISNLSLSPLCKYDDDDDFTLYDSVEQYVYENYMKILYSLSLPLSL